MAFSKVGEIRTSDNMWMYTDAIFYDVEFDPSTGEFRFANINSLANNGIWDSNAIREMAMYADTPDVYPPVTLNLPIGGTGVFNYSTDEFSPYIMNGSEVMSDSLMSYLVTFSENNMMQTTPAMTQGVAAPPNTVTLALTGMTGSAPSTVVDGGTVTVSNIMPTTGYIPPADVNITMGGAPMASGYTYTKPKAGVAGTLVITNVTDDLVIEITGVVGETYSITYDLGTYIAKNTGWSGAPASRGIAYSGDPAVFRLYIANSAYKLNTADPITNITMDGVELVSGTDYTVSSLSEQIITFTVPAVTGDILLQMTPVAKTVRVITFNSTGNYTVNNSVNTQFNAYEGENYIVNIKAAIGKVLSETSPVILKGSTPITSYSYVRSGSMSAQLTILASDITEDISVTIGAEALSEGSQILKIQSDVQHWEPTNDAIVITVNGSEFARIPINPSGGNVEEYVDPIPGGSEVVITWDVHEYLYRNIGLTITDETAGTTLYGLPSYMEAPTEDTILATYTLPGGVTEQPSVGGNIVLRNSKVLLRNGHIVIKQDVNS